MGIHQEDLQHLYDRFYRGKHVGSSSMPEAGLGLSIVKEIIDLHGGTIHVESHVNQGSIFEIRLPCNPNVIATPHE